LARKDHLRHRGGKQVGRQIVLPFSKSLEIAWKSLNVRLWRSLITMSGIILAIAFLMSVWTSASFTAALEAVPEDDASYSLVQQALQSEAMESQDVNIRVGILGAGGASSRQEHRVPPQVAVRDSLQGLQAFRPSMLPGQSDALKRSLDPPDAAEKPDAVVLVAFPPSLPGAEAVGALAGFVEAGGTLFVFGYEGLWPDGAGESPGQTLDALLPARPAGDARRLADGQIEPSGHGALYGVGWADHPQTELLITTAGEGGEPLAGAGDLAAFWLAPRGEGRVFWYPAAGEKAATAEALNWVLEKRLLASSLRWGAREKFRGGVRAKKNLWLVSLSLLVCIVGITNAMLMSVTERFREIGTMKCLGALDKFVVRLFLIESSIQGLVGSLVGALLGLLLAFARSLFAYHVTAPGTGEGHWLALSYFPLATVLMWMAVAVLVGAVLSVIAAIYPAYRAAKMEPVEAMRVEA